MIRDPQVLAYLHPTGRWVGLSAIGMVTTERMSDGGRRLEQRYYIMSGTHSVHTVAAAVRGYWGIENSMHGGLDVTFGRITAACGRATRRRTLPSCALCPQPIAPRAQEGQHHHQARSCRAR